MEWRQDTVEIRIPEFRKPASFEKPDCLDSGFGMVFPTEKPDLYSGYQMHLDKMAAIMAAAMNSFYSKSTIVFNNLTHFHYSNTGQVSNVFNILNLLKLH